MTTRQAHSDDRGAAAAQALIVTSKVVSAAIAHSLAVVDAKVTLPQLRILVMLEDSGPLNMSAVADGLGVNASNASRTCDRLVRAGMLDRRDDPDDRRNVLLTLTPAGRRLVASMLRQRRAILSQVIDHMPTADQDRLATALDTFNEAAATASHDGTGFSDGDGHLLRWLS
jgi:DNA-binding MarR family transcriptional regulator